MSIMMNGKMIAGGGVKPYKDETFFRTGTVAYNVTPNGIEWYEALADTKGDGLTSNKWKLLPDTPALGEFLNEGEVLTDKEGLEDVYKYAHSTFDKSKFTIVGSPSITDDGIASGFIGYPNTPYSYLKAKVPTLSNNFVINLGKYTFKSLSTRQFLVGNGTSTGKGIQIYRRNSDGNLILFLSSNGTSFDICNANASTKSIQSGSYNIRLKYSNGIYNLQASTDNDTWETYNTVTSNLILNNSDIIIGGSLSDVLYEPFLGSIDLKQFSITVDGVEVFSGNKTGIDTIKPDDYTVVGTPTISDDGVASGFSSSNYLSKSLDLSNFELDFSIKLNGALATDIIHFYTDDTTRLALYTRNSSNTFALYINGGNFYDLNAITDWYGSYDVKFIKNGTTITVKLYQNGTLLSTQNVTYTETISNIKGFYICAAKIFSGNAFAGSIDLNAFKIYVDGNLVYQPCLKIPYTESSERYNCKVVDDIYRDRVVDCYNQGYKNTYYTLGDSDYTLPMGNIFEVNKIQEITEESNTIEYPSAKAVQDKLHPLKGYIDEGEILTDKEGYNDLLKMAHSTFDASKFTKVGSPIITSDGIASGFSSRNYLKTNFQIGNLANKSWTIKDTFYFGGLPVNGVNVLIKLSESWISQGGVIYGPNGKLCLCLRTGTAEEYSTEGNKIELSNVFEGNGLYKYELNYNHSTGIYRLSCGLASNIGYSVTGTWTATTTNTQLKWINTNPTYNMTVGYGSTANDDFENGSIDLKQFSITVDGVEVFSGNKTGIDVIKPDDYTVVGTPTISEDGVASGFSGSNWINIVNSLSGLTKAYRFECEFTTSDLSQLTSTSGQNVFGVMNTNYQNMVRAAIRNAANNFKVGLDVFVGGTSVGLNSVNGLQSNTKYILHCGQQSDGSMFLRYKKFDDTNWIEEVTTNGTLANLTTVTTARIGQATHNTAEQFYGSIDLNAFKIYVDGDLVYQPCLKIPYTETEGGSKIVNQIYLDRVKDAYEQNYKDYKYFTIDEENKTYTLPMGNIYDNLSSNTRDIVGLKDLSNISKKGDDRLHALKGYAEEAEFLEDAEGYADVKHYRDSSFDLSKFTPEGSVSITDDGIASGFSNGANYISATLPSVSTYSTFEWYLGEVTVPNFSSNQWFYIADENVGGVSRGFRIQFNTSYAGKTRWFLGSGATTWDIVSSKIGDITYTANTKIRFKLVFNGTRYTLYSSVDGGSWQVDSYVDSTLKVYLVSTIYFGVGAANANDNSYLKGSIDLKQFSISVDGEEVFTGHQTGVDIIKQNNFNTITKIYAYTFGNNTVYADVPNNTNPTELYYESGGYYLDGAFDIIFDKVVYPEQTTRGNDDVTISGVTYYEFEHNSGGSTLSIWTNNVTTPTALFNQDGTNYTGTAWTIIDSKIYYLNVATYTSASDVIIDKPNATVDAGIKITEDGIASGFTSSNYMYKSVAIDKDSEIIIRGSADLVYSSDNKVIFLASDASDNTQLGIRYYSTQIQILARKSADSFAIATYNYNGNGHLDYELVFKNGEKIGCALKIDGVSVNVTIPEDLTGLTSNITTLWVGSAQTGAGAFLGGSIDLNAFKIYVDNKLVYQPLLRIPYTQSAHRYGSKIVTGKYIERVLDAYEQNFEQKYYSLDEENEKFALPLGEIYGLIESKIPKSSLQEVICIVNNYTFQDNPSAFCWDLSNGIRIQGASVAAKSTGANEYPLLKEFADTNYIAFKNIGSANTGNAAVYMSSIYNKTKSSFTTYTHITNTPKFDWIAIGRIDTWEA